MVSAIIGSSVRHGRNAHLARRAHRVAISNSRLVAAADHGVTFRYKDYRAKGRTLTSGRQLAATS